MSDPIADMLTRIRNANTAKHDTVDVPSSKMKLAIANILLDEGYIEKYELIEDGVFKTIHITLKYGADKNEKVITGLKRISKPGLRVYAGCEDLPKVLGGLGTAVISTNKGVITDREARKLGVGGEVLCYIWQAESNLAKASRKAKLEVSARPFSEISEVFHELSEENFFVKATQRKQAARRSLGLVLNVTENRVGKAHSENLS